MKILTKQERLKEINNEIQTLTPFTKALLNKNDISVIPNIVAGLAKIEQYSNCDINIVEMPEIKIK